MGHYEQTIPVAIVGGGPVGLMLALLLDLQGVASVVFNTEDFSRLQPKGNTHSSRTMEHYRRVGIAEQVRRAGLPADHPTDVAYFNRLKGWELARTRMPSSETYRKIVANTDTIDQIPEPIHRANQMYVEQILYGAAQTRPRIALRFGHTVTGFKDEGDRVISRAERCTDGRAEFWQSQFMVGCDGGQSFIRRTLNVHYAGSGSIGEQFLGGRMISTHVRIPDLHQSVIRDRRAWQYSLINPEMRLLLISLDGESEFLAMSKMAETGPLPHEAELAQEIRSGIGIPLPLVMLGSSSWNAGMALVAEHFSIGRVLLAGDAAHMFTPTGGFGMNTGIDDVANLAWKLAAVLQGWGGLGLIASYELERKPIARRNTVAARELAKKTGQVRTGSMLEEDTPAGKNARHELGEHLCTFSDQFASIGVQLGTRYDDSPIIVRDGAPPSDDFWTYCPTSAPGGRAPHFWLGSGRALGDSVFDRLGTGFTLLKLHTHARGAETLVSAARVRGIPLVVIEVQDPTVRDLYGCDLALVRPDQHIAWRGNTLSSNPDHILSRVTGSDGRGGIVWGSKTHRCENVR